MGGSASSVSTDGGNIDQSRISQLRERKSRLATAHLPGDSYLHLNCHQQAPLYPQDLLNGCGKSPQELLGSNLLVYRDISTILIFI